MRCKPYFSGPVMVLFSLFFIVFPSRHQTSHAEEHGKKKLVILTWSDYLDPDVIAEFEEKNSVEIVEIHYETDEMRQEMLVETDGKGFDIVNVNGVTIGELVKQGWLEPVSEDKIKNLRNADPKWKTAFPEADQYGVPFLWGTLGIAYRSDLVRKPINGWMDIFRPDEGLRGKIIMIKDSRDLIGAALKALGHSLNSTDEKELKPAEELLLAQKPYVLSYSYVSLTEKSNLVTGDALMAMVYSGDALTLKDFHEAIRYVQPVEGGNLWCDYLVIMKSSSNKGMAFQFLDYVNDPEVNARQAQFAHFAATNSAAEKLLPSDFLADPIIYPPKEILEKSETYSPLPPKTKKQYNSIFNRVIK